MNTSPPNYDWQLEAKTVNEFHAALNADGIGSNLPTSSGNRLGKLHLYELVFDIYEQSIERYVDGTWETGHTSYTHALNQQQHLRLFTNRNASKNMEGYCGEVIVSENLTPLVRLKTEGYLAWKWGISHQLPPSHPYRMTMPIN